MAVPIGRIAGSRDRRVRVVGLGWRKGRAAIIVAASAVSAWSRALTVMVGWRQGWVDMGDFWVVRIGRNAVIRGICGNRERGLEIGDEDEIVAEIAEPPHADQGDVLIGQQFQPAVPSIP